MALLLLLAQAPPPPQTTTAAAQDDYQIGVADVITITVFNEPDASRGNVTVDNDGTIDMPYIGRIKVGGLSARAVEKHVRELLTKILVNPSVSVEINKYRSKTVQVQGFVGDPGEQILEGNASLPSVLAKAGSMNIDAASYVLINRREADGTTTTIRVTRKQIESGEARSVLLKDGDTVVVPKAETFFITGHVRSTGNFAWEDGLTIERALSLAGGATERAGKIEIERKGKTITKNAKRTDLVQANDTIRVKQRWL